MNFILRKDRPGQALGPNHPSPKRDTITCYSQYTENIVSAIQIFKWVDTWALLLGQYDVKL